MSFTPISIDLFIRMYLEENPAESENDIRKRLSAALLDCRNDIKCSCGGSLWVIGSAMVGNSCFTCITGEACPKDDYEIDLAM